MIENEGGIKFYRREGWKERAYAFVKNFKTVPSTYTWHQQGWGHFTEVHWHLAKVH